MDHSRSLFGAGSGTDTVCQILKTGWLSRGSLEGATSLLVSLNTFGFESQSMCEEHGESCPFFFGVVLVAFRLVPSRHLCSFFS